MPAEVRQDVGGEGRQVEQADRNFMGLSSQGALERLGRLPGYGFGGI
jgi:hypothetical protein